MLLVNSQPIRLILSPDKNPYDAPGTISAVEPRELRVVLDEPNAIPSFVTPGLKAILEIPSDGGVQAGSTNVLHLDPARPRALWVAAPGAFQGQNRRTLLRLNFARPFQFTVVESNDPAHRKFKNVAALSKDLSAGGIRFETSHELHVGDLLMIALDSAGPGSKAPAMVEIKGRVLRSKALEGEKTPRWISAVEFVEVPERHRSALIRLVFLLQRQAV